METFRVQLGTTVRFDYDSNGHLGRRCMVGYGQPSNHRRGWQPKASVIQEHANRMKSTSKVPLRRLRFSVDTGRGIYHSHYPGSHTSLLRRYQCPSNLFTTTLAPGPSTRVRFHVQRSSQSSRHRCVGYDAYARHASTCRTSCGNPSDWGEPFHVRSLVQRSFTETQIEKWAMLRIALFIGSSVYLQ